MKESALFRFCRIGAAVFRLATFVAIAGTSACHRADAPTQKFATAGIPWNRYFENVTGEFSPSVSYARRFDSSPGAETDVWISVQRLDANQRELFEARSLADAEISRLNATGILLRIKDDGSNLRSGFVICAEIHTIECKSAEGVVVISKFDANEVIGSVYAESADHKQRYAIDFDASLSNTSARSVDSTIRWSADGGDAGIVFSNMMTAASVKDAAALRALSVPEREHDWDHFGIITQMQRVAAQQPHVIASSQFGDNATLWILPTSGDGAARLPFRVELKKIGDGWRYSQMVF